MMKIFLSYAIGDRALGEEIGRQLTNAKITVLSAYQMPASENLASQVFSRIQESDAAVVIFGKNRENVMLELGYAMGAGKNVLILAETQEALPVELSTVPFVRLCADHGECIAEIIQRLAYFQSSSRIPSREYVFAASKLGTFSKDPRYFESIDESDFEQLLIDWFQQVGFAVEKPKDKCESGYDFIVKSPLDGRRLMVQAKKLIRQSRVSVGQVETLIGKLPSPGVDAAIIISPSGFTNSALSLADRYSSKILMMTMDDLLRVRSAKDLFERYELVKHHTVRLEVECRDRVGIVRDIAVIFSEQAVELSEISLSNGAANKAYLILTIEIDDLSRLGGILKLVESVNDVIKVAIMGEVAKVTSETEQ